MRLIVALLAIIGMVGFAGFVRADEPQTASTAPRKGVFVKLDGKKIDYKGGAKGTGKDWYFVTDEKTVVMLDGKPAKLTDLKAGLELSFTVNKELVATKVEATNLKAPTTAPAEKK